VYEQHTPLNVSKLKFIKHIWSLYVHFTRIVAVVRLLPGAEGQGYTSSGSHMQAGGGVLSSQKPSNEDSPAIDSHHVHPLCGGLLEKSDRPPILEKG
jgi:hypothetical protein